MSKVSALIKLCKLQKMPQEVEDLIFEYFGREFKLLNSMKQPRQMPPPLFNKILAMNQRNGSQFSKNNLLIMRLANKELSLVRCRNERLGWNNYDYLERSLIQCFARPEVLEKMTEFKKVRGLSEYFICFEKMFIYIKGTNTEADNYLKNGVTSFRVLADIIEDGGYDSIHFHRINK